MKYKIVIFAIRTIYSNVLSGVFYADRYVADYGGRKIGIYVA